MIYALVLSYHGVQGWARSKCVVELYILFPFYTDMIGGKVRFAYSNCCNYEWLLNSWSAKTVGFSAVGDVSP